MRHTGDVVRGHVRDAAYERVSHGLFERRRFGHEPADRPELRRWGTWLAVLPPDARFTHVTGAALRGWPLPRLPEFVPVFAATAQDERRPRRLGLQVSRLTHPTEVELRLGLPVECSPEILLRCARDLAHLDLVALIDSARRLGDVDEGAIRTLMATSRPGVVPLRRAWERSSDRSESLWETYLRIFHEVVGVPVEPQVDLLGDDGQVLGRADLLIRGTPYVQEYDGAVHRLRAVQRRDLLRERRLAGSPYVRRGYTAADLLSHDEATLREIDSMLGRRHDPGRLTRWRALVAASCLTRAGRARLSNRWLGRPPGC